MENDLENTLQKLQLGQENNIEELNRVRTKKLREDKIRGIIMRTKAKWNITFILVNDIFYTFFYNVYIFLIIQ
jgi:SMC interacting uncharacterized protein involved in chromosome segregation